MPNDDDSNQDFNQDGDENSDQDTGNNDDDTEEEAVVITEMLDDFEEYTKQAEAKYCQLLPEVRAGIELLLLLHKKGCRSAYTM
jgi:hypothetical protein